MQRDKAMHKKYTYGKDMGKKDISGKDIKDIIRIKLLFIKT